MDFTSYEIKRGVFDMYPFKALGLNGMHAGFYQHSWDLVGDFVCKFFLNFFCNWIFT